MAFQNDAARPEPAKGQTSRGHYPVLDGLRGVAALMVVAVHTTTLHGPSIADRIVLRTSTLGWCGVDHIVRNFYIRRVLRIWPLYLAFLTCCLLIAPAISGQRTSIDLLGPHGKLAYWLHF